MQTEEIKKIVRKRFFAELILAAIIFFALIIFPPQNLSFNLLKTFTGNFVIDEPEEVQINVQEFFRDEAFNALGNNAKLCLSIKGNNGESYDYKIRKRGGIINIERAEPNCEGIANEDIILEFMNYKSFLELKDNRKATFFTTEKNSKKFSFLESKYVKVGGLIMCDIEFKDKYCNLINKHLSRAERKKYGLDCCKEDFEEQQNSFLSTIEPFFISFWWLIAVIIFSVLIGAGSLFAFSSPEEDDELESNEEISNYIIMSRKQGYGENVIKEALLSAGWPEHIIEIEFEKLRLKDLQTLEDRFEKVDLDKEQDKTF